MGRRKEVKFFGRHLIGSRLDTETARTLLKLHDLTEDSQGIEELKDLIYVLSDQQINEIRRRGYSLTDEEKIIREDLENGTLTNMQTIGVLYMYLAKRVLLGDSVGLGKTVQISALAKYLSEEYARKGYSFRVLYLTEGNLTEQSTQELIKFSGLYFRKLSGLTKDVGKFVKYMTEDADDLAINVCGPHSLIKNAMFHKYLKWHKDTTGFPAFDMVVVDESGALLTNNKSQAFQLGKQIADEALYVIEMNAGSFENSLDKFYNQLEFLDDTLLFTQTEFSEKYKIMDWSSGRPRFDGKYKNAEDFREKIKLRYLKRTRRGQGADMRSCSAELIEVKPSKIQKEFLTKSSLPQMVYDCPPYFDERVEFSAENVPKAGALLELLRGKLKEVDQVLVYTTLKEPHKYLKEFLAEHGITSEIMNGSTPTKLREQIISGFKTKKVRVLITNVQRGLNFGSCNHCVFYNYDGNPNNMVQFEGRITREFNIVNKHVYIIVTKGSEKSKLISEIAKRAEASHEFAGSDFSMVLDLLSSQLLERQGKS